MIYGGRNRFLLSIEVPHVCQKDAPKFRLQLVQFQKLHGWLLTVKGDFNAVSDDSISLSSSKQDELPPYEL